MTCREKKGLIIGLSQRGLRRHGRVETMRALFDPEGEMRFSTVLLSIFFAGALVPACALAADLERAVAQTLRIENAWLRAPAPGQTTAVAYLELTSARNRALVAAASPAAASIEMHETTMPQGVMRMRAIGRVALPAGVTVKLAPGGVHLMLVDLKRPLKAGDTVPLTLDLEEAGPSARRVTTISLDVPVRPSAPVAHMH